MERTNTTNGDLREELTRFAATGELPRSARLREGARSIDRYLRAVTLAHGRRATVDGPPDGGTGRTGAGGRAW